MGIAVKCYDGCDRYRRALRPLISAEHSAVLATLGSPGRLCRDGSLRHTFLAEVNGEVRGVLIAIQQECSDELRVVELNCSGNRLQKRTLAAELIAFVRESFPEHELGTYSPKVIRGYKAGLKRLGADRVEGMVFPPLRPKSVVESLPCNP